jgi:hypothetical protein
MWVDAFDSLISWINDRVNALQAVIAAALSESEWVLLSEDFTAWGLELRGHFTTIVYASYGLLIVVGGLILMSHESLQTRYTARELAPRLIVGFLLAGCSFVIVLQALEINNDVAEAFLTSDAALSGAGTTDSAVMWELTASRDLGTETPSVDQLLLEMLWILLTIVCLILLLFVSIMRNIVWFFLVALGPIGLACHALPSTEWAAHLWWRMLGACMASSIGQAVLIWVWNSLLWPDGRSETGRYFGEVGHIGFDAVYLLVVIWMMWQVHKNAFRLARGRPLRVPGSRFLTGAATALAVGAVTGRFRKRRGGNAGRQQQSEPETPEADFWWDQRQGRASHTTDLGAAFGHRPPFTEVPPKPSKTAPWWDRQRGEAPEQPARPGEGAYDSMFEPAHPLEHSRRLGGFATDAGRRRGIEQRLSDAENDRLASERLRQRAIGAKPRSGRRLAEVPPLSKGAHQSPGSPVVRQDSERVERDVISGPTPEQELWDRAAEALGDRGGRGHRQEPEVPLHVEVVQGVSAEHAIWEAAASRVSQQEERRTRDAAERRRRAEEEAES